MNRRFNFRAMSREKFVNRIVHHLGNAVMQSPFVRAADVHSRLLPNGLQTFEFSKLRGTIFLSRLGRGGHGLRV
jgi:hypothetical protein